MTPQSTRLTFVSARKRESLVAYIRKIPFRVQIYSIAWDGDRWVCWFVPPDDIGLDVAPKDL